MDITPAIPRTHKTITGYGAGGFKLNHEPVEGSVLLFADEYQPWEVKSFKDIDFQKLSQWCAQKNEVELLLIGTGKGMMPLPAEFKESIKKQNVAVDVMDTGAACRTYNILLAEERKVAAALVAV